MVSLYLNVYNFVKIFANIIAANYYIIFGNSEADHQEMKRAATFIKKYWKTFDDTLINPPK
mgnify:CR=1 FL=1